MSFEFSSQKPVGIASFVFETSGSCEESPNTQKQGVNSWIADIIQHLHTSSCQFWQVLYENVEFEIMSISARILTRSTDRLSVDGVSFFDFLGFLLWKLETEIAQ